jgi:hypothetical protein
MRSPHLERLVGFFTPGQEILVATTTSEAVEALKLPLGELAVVARNARNRALEEHTASHRAIEFERQLEDAFAQRCFPSCRLTASQNNLAPQQTI